MATRWVVVDDTSADINYIGDSWFSAVGGLDSVFGPPYLSTLHGTNSSASLSFNFTGSRVRVVGTNQIRNDSGVIDPQWTCYVDGLTIDAGSPFQYPENNWRFCSAYNLTDGQHTITVNATVARSQTFWFDRIEYVPSTSVSLASKTIKLTSVDPAIRYGSGWSDSVGINWTQGQGTLVTLNFYGTSLSWYGHILAEWNGNATTAKWVIDDKPAQVFILQGHALGAATMYNQKFFETAVYPQGAHTLTVTYNGDDEKTPLVLAFLVIQNGTVANSTTTGSTSSAVTPTSTSTSSETPAIVGGVIGGVACLLIVILLLVLYRRRRRQKKKERRGTVESDYVPVVSQATSYDPISRLPAKALEGYSGSTLTPSGHRSVPSGPSPINIPQAPTRGKIRDVRPSLLMSSSQFGTQPTPAPQVDTVSRPPSYTSSL